MLEVKRLRAWRARVRIYGRDDRGIGKRNRRELKPYQKQIELACTVPGIGPTAAASILAETGMNMSPEGPFPEGHHLAKRRRFRL